MKRKQRPCICSVRDFLLAYEGSTPSQNSVLMAMAIFAEPDGTRIFPGTRNLYLLTGLKRGKRGKLNACIDYWLRRRILVEVAEARPKHSTEYRIDLHRINHFLDRNSVPTGVPSGDTESNLDSVPPSVPSGDQTTRSQNNGTRYPAHSDSVPFGKNTVPPGVPQEESSGGTTIQEQQQQSALAKVAAAAAEIERAFGLLDHGAPFGSFEFQLEWLATVQSSPEHVGDVLAAHQQKKWAELYAFLPHTIERCIQRCKRKGIIVPPPFYREARMAEHSRDAHCRR